jgi:lipopolysaccharide biosynthesis glycosyltransferase
MSKGVPWSAWIGFDPREAAAFAVCKSSIRRRTFAPLPVRGVVLEHLRFRGLYYRPTERRDGRLWDVISDAPMSTEFAIARFLVPHLAGSGWALFLDSDMLVRANLAELFEQADPSKAVYVVKHKHEPPPGEKMDGQAQVRYARKNWSSAMLFNCDHPANRKLTVELINTVPGRDLHRFCWLKDREIGKLHPEWNYLVGHTKLPRSRTPKIVHWTEGLPFMPGYENTEYASEFWAELQRWAA